MGGFRCFSGLTGITDWSRGCIGLDLGLYLKKQQIIEIERRRIQSGS
jgi:hypothetical protein